MAIKKKLDYKELLAELQVVKKNSKGHTIKRISGKTFKELMFALAVDTNTEATSYFFSKAGEVTKGKNIKSDMDKFMNKLLKHAGLKDETERKNIVAAFEYSSKDIDFIPELYEETAYQVIEAGKTLNMFANKPMGLTLSKAVRTGKFEGQETIRRKITDRRKKLAKLLKK